MIQFKDVRIRDIAYFRQGDQLLIFAERDELLVLCADWAVVAEGRVRVVAEDINDIVAGVPRWGDGIPDPDQVAELMVVGEAVEHEAV